MVVHFHVKVDVLEQLEIPHTTAQTTVRLTTGVQEREHTRTLSAEQQFTSKLCKMYRENSNYYYPCNTKFRFSGGDWIRDASGREADWEFRVNGSLAYRQDTGMVNSAPVVNIPPQIRLQHGCSHTLKVPGSYIIIIIASYSYIEPTVTTVTYM